MTRYHIRCLSIYIASLAIFVNTWEPHGRLIDIVVAAVCVFSGWILRAVWE